MIWTLIKLSVFSHHCSSSSETLGGITRLLIMYDNTRFFIERIFESAENRIEVISVKLKHPLLIPTIVYSCPSFLNDLGINISPFIDSAPIRAAFFVSSLKRYVK